jgi:hypothetical protein
MTEEGALEATEWLRAGRDFLQEKTLPRRSEYERSAIDVVRCRHSKKDIYDL